MRIGDWDVRGCLAGNFGLDGGAMFGVVPKAIWERLLPPDDANRIPMAMRILVARAGDRTVLVDVGAGSGYDEKSERIYAFRDVVSLPEALAAVGVQARAVTDIVLTHLHFDHAAGVVEREGGDWRLVFPGAVHHVQRSQWAHALRPNPRDRASYLLDRLQVMERENVMEFHDGQWSLYPGFDLLVFDGHSPGQQLPRISGEEGTLFYCGDLVPTQHHLPPPYVMAYDLDPVRTMEEKVPLLERAADENWVLFFEHDADLPACRVVRDGSRVRRGDRVTM
jgi:glyoxylase-like metal-dependent hydrolase (beta-lactamase superfamily II)